MLCLNLSRIIIFLINFVSYKDSVTQNSKPVFRWRTSAKYVKRTLGS